MAYCEKCLHEEVCALAKVCVGRPQRCKHFMDKTAISEALEKQEPQKPIRANRIIIKNGTAAECAKAMNRSRASFYCLVDRVRNGRNKRYTVLKRYMDEEEQEDG